MPEPRASYKRPYKQLRNHTNHECGGQRYYQYSFQQRVGSGQKGILLPVHRHDEAQIDCQRQYAIDDCHHCQPGVLDVDGRGKQEKLAHETSQPMGESQPAIAER